MNLLLGDCREVLKTLPDASVDSVVTDPPYELGFMGKAWDASGVAYDVQVWREVLRVLKPGGHLLAFGGARTYHRLACAVEDAGFEIRDQIMWVYGSGFPKSLDVSKAIDKAAGEVREVIGRKTYPDGTPVRVASADSKAEGWKRPWMDDGGTTANMNITAPATDAARRWSGWGTALKPAHEPIVVARRPLIGTVAENVLAFGCGAINVDGCRIGTDRTLRTQFDNVGATGWTSANRSPIGGSDCGRWPANLIHDGSAEVLERFPETKNGGQNETAFKGGPMFFGTGSVATGATRYAGDTGSAARFFYTAKSDSEDRNQGCEGVMTWESVDLSHETERLLLHLKATSDDTTRLLDDFEWSTILFGNSTTALSQKAIKCIIETASKLITESRISNYALRLNISECILDAIKTLTANGLNLAESAECLSQSAANSTNGEMASALGVVSALLQTLSKINERAKRGNVHSTVKPVDLMRYLCRLVTPPGGIVLDPFMGSGSTGKAAALERFDFIGIELDPDYLEIARARIAWLGTAPMVNGSTAAPSPVQPPPGVQLALTFA